MLDNISDLVDKIDRKARKPWTTQEMINKIDERKNRKDINNEESNIENLWSYWKEPQTRPRRLSWEHVWRCHGISKNRTLWCNVNVDEGCSLEEYHGIETLALKILLGEYNSRLERSTDNLRELYYRVLRFIQSTRTHRIWTWKGSRSRRKKSWYFVKWSGKRHRWDEG